MNINLDHSRVYLGRYVDYPDYDSVLCFQKDISEAEMNYLLKILRKDDSITRRKYLEDNGFLVREYNVLSDDICQVKITTHKNLLPTLEVVYFDKNRFEFILYRNHDLIFDYVSTHNSRFSVKDTDTGVSFAGHYFRQDEYEIQKFGPMFDSVYRIKKKLNPDSIIRPY